MKKVLLMFLIIVLFVTLISCEKTPNEFVLEKSDMINSWICTPTIIQGGFSVSYLKDDYLKEIKGNNLEYHEFLFQNNTYYILRLNSDSDTFLVSVFKPNGHANELVFLGSAFLGKSICDSNLLMRNKKNESINDVSMIDKNTNPVELDGSYYSFHYCKDNKIVEIKYDNLMNVIEKNIYDDDYQIVDAFLFWIDEQ